MFCNRYIGLILCVITSFTVYSQTNIKGTIYDNNAQIITNATVYLVNTSFGTTSDNQGHYSLPSIPKGNYQLSVSILGYSSKTKSIHCTGNEIKIDFRLDRITEQLEEVIVATKSKSQVLRETAYRPEVLELKNVELKATPVIDMVSQLSGIRVRQQGGLGSDANIMINGISGKGIKTFVDGIPLDLLGKGYNLNNISPNLIKQIEVYKGVVPVSFGSDALGGIVNIETKNTTKNYTSAFYSIGSWNTHKLGFGLKKYIDTNKKHFIQLDGFFNYSDNDYWMDDVDVVVDELLNTKKGRVRRFHDQYKSYLARFQYGIQNVSWTDDFRFFLGTSSTDKEWQHGITAIVPWGEVTEENSSINSHISWKKDSKNKDWFFSAITGYNHLNVQFNDVSKNIYFWDGTAVSSISTGESGFYVNGRTPNINTNNYFVRTNNNYRINNTFKLNFTSLFSSSSLKGRDEAGTATFENDFYTKPQTFAKSFAGISLESTFLDEKVTNITSVKHYWLKSKIAGLKSDNSFDDYIENNNSSFGYGNVLKINWFPKLFNYFAYEYTLRLPDGNELFGDGINIGTNPLLIPEKNHNLNIGFKYSFFEEAIQIDVNGFLRHTKNAIFLQPLSRGLSSYFNLLKTKAIGADVSIVSSPLNNLSLFANATWQKTTLKEPDRYGQIDQRHIGSRIPNNPYLFSNIGGTYKIPNVFINHSRLELGYTLNHIHTFFRSWEKDAINDVNKANTPTQIIQNTSIGFVFPNDKYSIFLECRNLTNQKAYDNYLVQKPGRSFYLKINMHIN